MTELASPISGDDQVVVPPPKRGKNGKSSNKALWIILGVVGVLILIPVILVIIAGAVLNNKFGTPDRATKTLESAVKSSTDGKVDLNSKDGTVTVKDDEGNTYTSTTSSTKMPEDFPRVIPQFSPATISSAASTSSSGKKGWYVTVTTSSSKDAVASFFKTKLAADGWTDSSTYDSGDTGTMSAKNTAAGLSLIVSYTAENGKVTITYAASEE